MKYLNCDIETAEKINKVEKKLKRELNQYELSLAIDCFEFYGNSVNDVIDIISELE